jgi:fluoride exporter
MMNHFIYVAIGGALGACMRYSLSFIPWSNQLPWATFIANVLGCFVIGVTIAFFQTNKINQSHYILLATGVCGGFTTFSTFSLENIQLLQQQKWATFALYTLSTVTLCMLATFIGWRIVTNK